MHLSSISTINSVHILPVSVTNTAVVAAAVNNGNKKVIFKSCVSFTQFICRINNTQVENAKDNDVVFLNTNNNNNNCSSNNYNLMIVIIVIMFRFNLNRK